jgi:drug/metabolite transporter (DMT)-like permease
LPSTIPRGSTTGPPHEEPARRALSPRSVGLLTVGTGVLLLSPDSLGIGLLSASLWTIIFWRGVCTATGYLAVTWARRRHAPGRRSARATWAIGGLSAVGNVCFVFAVTHTTAAQTLVILASSPLLAAVITHVCGLEPIERRTWVATAIVVPCVGAIVLGAGVDGLAVGDLVALAGAFALAGLLVVVRHTGPGDVVPALAFGGVLTAAVAAPFAATLSLSSSDALVLAVGCGILLPLSLTLIMRGPRYLAAPEVGLIMLLETVLGPMWVWLALGQRPATHVALAGATIVATLALSAGRPIWRKEDLA